jgi:hypothetical protein
MPALRSTSPVLLFPVPVVPPTHGSAAFPSPDRPAGLSLHSFTRSLSPLTSSATKDIIYGYFRTSFLVRLPLIACPRLQRLVFGSCGAKGPSTTSRSFVSENEIIKPETMSVSDCLQMRRGAATKSGKSQSKTSSCAM